MIQDVLHSIGLTEGETNIYLALVELGSSTTGKITKKSGISGSKVYEVLDRLIKKGLASHTTKNGVKHFEASKPERILDYLDEKEQKIEQDKNVVKNILPELLLKAQSAPASEVKVFTGWEGLKTANEDIITTLKKGEEWLSMGLTEQPKSWEIYFTKKQKIRAAKGILHKHLLNKKYRTLHKKRKSIAHTAFRFLPADFEMPTSTEIYKNKVMIMVISQEAPVAIMIESKATADSFRKYFYALWETAERPKM
jgi:sugar-specific transcriptional regulator TrmB